VEIWQECLRVLKPGGHLLAFAGTRTQHRMAIRIEDAGFEIRDMIAWIYGSGFPKSLNIGKAVDKLLGNERAVIGKQNYTCQDIRGNSFESQRAKERPRLEQEITIGSSLFEGWGTALKPALEPITVARKPISENNIAENCLKHGTGGINIDGCRVENEDDTSCLVNTDGFFSSNAIKKRINGGNAQGRFPANLIHDGSDEVLACFPETKVGARKSGQLRHTKVGGLNFTGNTYTINDYPANEGSAARFFYCAKASKSERNAGCDELPKGEAPASARSKAAEGRNNPLGEPRQNHHPTVKPIAVMQWLLRLVTPKGGITLDPFSGSGSTQCAAIREGFHYIGCEISEEYLQIAAHRIDTELDQTDIFRSV
jgi:DNA modification methylase